jgi:hypothetical protein
VHRKISKDTYKNGKQAEFMYAAEPLSYNTLARPLAIALGHDLPGDTVGCVPACRIMILHVDSAAGCPRQPFQELHIHLWIVGAHERESHERSTPKMLTYKSVYSFSILEAAEQRRQTDRLIVQRKHNLMHYRKGSVAGFS